MRGGRTVGPVRPLSQVPDRAQEGLPLAAPEIRGSDISCLSLELQAQEHCVRQRKGV